MLNNAKYLSSVTPDYKCNKNGSRKVFLQLLAISSNNNSNNNVSQDYYYCFCMSSDIV